MGLLDDDFYSSLLGKSGDNQLANDPFESVDRTLTRYDNAGAEAPKPSTSMSFLEGLGKVLNYPGNIVRSAVYGNGWNDVGQAFLGQKEFNTRDELSRMGMKDGLGKTLLGFAGDVLTDPLMLTGSGLVKNAGKGILESGVVKGMAEKTAGSMALKTAEETKFGMPQIQDALLGFSHPVDASSDAYTAARHAMGGLDVTGQSLEGLKQTTRTALNVAEEGVLGADRDLGALLSGQVTNITGKPLKVRNKLVEGLTNGTLTGKNDWVDSSSFVEIYKKLKDSIGSDMTGTQIGDLMRMYRADAPEIHVLANMADTFGTKIKDMDSAFNMAKKLGNSDYVDDVVRANERLFGETQARDAAKIRAVFSNNLVAEIDKLGNRRYWGIAMPNGKVVLPLVDVTPVSQAVNKIADQAYLRIPGYKPFSDWFRRSIANDFTRDAYMQGGKFLDQLQQGKTDVTKFNQLKQNMPHLGADFIQNAMGKEIVDADARVLRAVPYLTERNMVRYITQADGSTKTLLDPYTAYIWGNIAEDAGKTAVSAQELIEAEKFILSEKGPEGLAHIQDTIIKPIIASGKLTEQEIALAKHYSEKSRVASDILFQHEKLQGSPLTDTDYNPWYMYHTYDTGAAQMGAQSSRSQAMMNTNTALKSAKAREYMTIGEAIADDLNLNPVDNIVELMASRFNVSLRYGMNRALIKGIDDLFEGTMQNAVRQVVKDKGLNDMQTLSTGDFTKLADRSAEDLARVRSLRQTAQATNDAVVKAMGGLEGLNELKLLIKPAKHMKTKDFSSGMWQPIENVFGYTRSGGSNSVYYVHKDLYTHIENLSRPIASSEGMRQLLGFTDKVTRYIKTLQTTLSPTFAARNFAGESTMSYLNGTTIDAVQDAGSILKNVHGTTDLNGKSMYIQEAMGRLKTMQNGESVVFGGKTMTVAEAKAELKLNNAIDIGGTTRTIQEIYDSAVKQGLISAGHTSEYALTEQDRVAQMLAGNTAGQKAKYAYKSSASKGGTINTVLGAAKAGESVAESAANYGDALFRLSDYIHNLRQGMTEVQAAAKVKTFHVDYNDLTQFEKGTMRRVVPYYTFMRHNIPIQLKLLIERPAYYGTIGTLIDNSYAALGDPATPDYLKKGLALPIYKDDDGNTHYLNWNLPLTDLSKFRDSPAETGRQFLQMLTPLIKAPMELATGHNIAFQAPFDPTTYLTSQLGGANTVGKAISEAMAPDSQFEGQYVKPKQAPLVGGMFPTVNPEKEQLSRAYAYREQLLADMQERTKKGQPIPEMPKAPNFGNNTLYGITPYSLSYDYQKNKDFVRRNGKMFTP